MECNLPPAACVIVTGCLVPGVNWGRTPTAIMSVVRLSLSLFGTVAVISAVLASATIWLLVTDPVTVADAVETGQVSPLVQALAGVLYDAFKGILRYL